MKDPYRYVPLLSNVYRKANANYFTIKHRGQGKVCPFCEKEFGSWADYISDGTCPSCGSCSRHRLLFLYMQSEPALLAANTKLLHFAAEPCFAIKFRNNPSLDYTTVDLSAAGVDVHTDITRMIFKDNSFDLIICVHVLEHIPDDNAAMKELQRVLRPGGSALIMVPYNANGITDEDPSVVDPRERTRRFGQFDHVRVYGRDVKDQLQKASFAVNEIRPVQKMSKDQAERYGLWDDVIFHCKKPVLPQN